MVKGKIRSASSFLNKNKQEKRSNCIPLNLTSNEYVTETYVPARGGVVTFMVSFLKFLTSTCLNLSSTTNRSLIVIVIVLSVEKIREY